MQFYFVLITLPLIISHVTTENNMTDINALYNETLQIHLNAAKCNIKDGTCCYQQALEEVNSTETNEILAQFYKTCEENLSSQEDDVCQYADDFTQCLQEIVNTEYIRVHTECKKKHIPDSDIEKYYKASIQERIETENFACYDLCFHIAIGKVNEDLTFNYLEDNFLEVPFEEIDLVQAAEDCIKQSEVQSNRCSKGSHRIQCLHEKIYGRELDFDELHGTNLK